MAVVAAVMGEVARVEVRVVVVKVVEEMVAAATAGR